jgi:hypothetical protein
MNSLEINTIIVDYYNLGTVYCKKILSKGVELVWLIPNPTVFLAVLNPGNACVCVSVHNSINYWNIKLDIFCIDHIIEIRAITFQSAGQNICIVAIYRVPSGNFSRILNSLDRALNTIYRSGVEFIVCHDLNLTI